MDKYKFGELIYTQRKKLGLTQDELGRRLKVTNKAVSKWETGETLPDVLLLKPLADELQISVDELLTQQKPKVEKVYVKPKAFPYVILGVVIFILLLSLSILTLSFVSTKYETINVENASEFYQINCCDKSTLDNYDLTIDGSILETTDIKNALLVFEIDIQYYYLNENDEVCEILYLGRTFTYDGSSSQFSITVSPKNTINDFKSFYGFNIEYTIIEANGRATH